MIALFLSAFCYTFPFWLPTFWPLIFLFPAFLTRAYLNKIPTQSAFVWALLVSFGHMLPPAQALYRMSLGSMIIRATPGILLITLLTLCIGIWLWIASQLKNIILWIASIWLFLIIIDRGLLMLFGSLNGLIFMNPVLVLPAELLQLLPHIGMILFLAIFCITSSCIGLSFYQKNNILLLCSLIPWALSPLLMHKKNPLNTYQTIGYLPIMIPQQSDGSALLNNLLARIHTTHPHLKTIIIPESAFPTAPKASPDINIILGTFENYEIARSNVACWLYKETQIIFRKKHSMIFGEQLPYWLDNSFFHQLLFSTTHPILISDNERPQWKITSDLTVIPYICSELFFANSPHDDYHDPIVAICNDWWFGSHYKQLLARAARLKAIQWHRPIIYVSYAYGQFYDEFGNIFPLERL